jgi:hypothetical protein
MGSTRGARSRIWASTRWPRSSWRTGWPRPPGWRWLAVEAGTTTVDAELDRLRARVAEVDPAAREAVAERLRAFLGELVSAGTAAAPAEGRSLGDDDIFAFIDNELGL